MTDDDINAELRRWAGHEEAFWKNALGEAAYEYAALEIVTPLIYDRTVTMQAWAFVNGAWQEQDLAEVLQIAATMTPEEFRARWPDLPDLPETEVSDESR